MAKSLRTMGVVSLTLVAVLLLTPGTSQAQHFHSHGFNPGYNPGFVPAGGYFGDPYYNGPVYHQPSVHYDPVFHAEYSHWTPGLGYHTHGHIDYVPHYTPGHFDYQHGNHIHVNPYFHQH